MVVITWLRIERMNPAIDARTTVAAGRMAWLTTLPMYGRLGPGVVAYMS